MSIEDPIAFLNSTNEWLDSKPFSQDEHQARRSGLTAFDKLESLRSWAAKDPVLQNRLVSTCRRLLVEIFGTEPEKISENKMTNWINDDN